MPTSLNRTAPIELASYLLAGAALVVVLQFHLLAALIAGLLVHEMVALAASQTHLNRVAGRRARAVAVVLLSILTILLLVGFSAGVMSIFHGETGAVPAILQKSGEIAALLRQHLPAWLAEHLPSSGEELRGMVSRWLTQHLEELRLVGGAAGRGVVLVLLGMVIGAIVSLSESLRRAGSGPLTLALLRRTGCLAESFRKVVFAQVRIAALNAFLTWLFLAVVLPLAGAPLPLTKTLVAITFIAGLLPVIGNLISNTMITVVAMSQSLGLAVAALVFLVTIHKLEYFLNARIVGSRIQARSWEILLAMIVLEAIFGLPGVIAAPIYYAYLKAELKAAALI
ncbi:AI-2E family transporter [Pseudogulbenkiania sp. MAI-1]|uniref:AI-2E family transporter n=1 Tax=Pseudogulbenkiania sp. MAI-1 TaxID=990370 RepID=UPI00045E8363|nr:AI-2E family transporter [Pseudogulbenkiania sp. MAI-1]